MRVAYAVAVAAMAGTASAFQSGDLMKSAFARGGHFRAFTFDGSESSPLPVYYGDFRGINRGTSDLKLDATIHSFEPSADGELMSWSLVDDQLSFALKKKDAKGGEEVVTEGCMELNDAIHALPPYRLLSGAMDRFFPVSEEHVRSSPSMEVAEVCDPQMVQFFEWTGEKYIACQGHMNHGSFYAMHIFGKGFHVELTPSKTDLKISPLNPSQHAKCPSLYSEAAHVYPVATPDSFKFSEKDWPWLENEDDMAARRLASGKECIFFHGTGQTDESAPTSTYTDYWGDVHKDTRQCASRRFAHFDTKNNAWTDRELQRKHCEVLLGGTGFQGWDTTGQVVENKIIFFSFHGKFDPRRCHLKQPLPAGQQHVVVRVPGTVGGQQGCRRCARRMYGMVGLGDPSCGVGRLLCSCSGRKLVHKRDFHRVQIAGDGDRLHKGASRHQGKCQGCHVWRLSVGTEFDLFTCSASPLFVRLVRRRQRRNGRGVIVPQPDGI